MAVEGHMYQQRRGQREKLARSSRLLRRSLRRSRRLHVACDLGDELVLARERPLVAQALPQLEAEVTAVEVPLEVDEKRLDAPLGAAVVQVDADRRGGAVTDGGPRVDPVGGDEKMRRRRDVRRGKAERAASPVARDDRSLDLVGAAEEPCGGFHLTLVEQPADAARRDPFDEGDRM